MQLINEDKATLSDKGVQITTRSLPSTPTRDLTSSSDAAFDKDVELGRDDIFDDEDDRSPRSEGPSIYFHQTSDSTEALLISDSIPQSSSWSSYIICRLVPRPWRRRYSSRNEKSRGVCRRRNKFVTILRLLAVCLMLLGLLELLTVAFGIFEGFFPEELDESIERWSLGRHSKEILRWPTDYLADVQPVHCHSHNDYWRRVPLKSALRAGCTGVEADVWHFSDSDSLFVGHSKSALTPQRTFTALYIDPLVEILNRQNPNTSFHRSLDKPRNGVFDTVPEQTLVFLIDFKTDGAELWPYVSAQLEPLRRRNYLSHFNGTDFVEGPVTIVVTGNAPFDKVVENPYYRDMFFDAPLDMMASLAPIDGPTSEPETLQTKPKSTPLNSIEGAKSVLPLLPHMPAPPTNPSNQGQGHSGSAPTNPAIYSPANSYYASVSFTSSIGIPLPFLRNSQRQKIRQQIAGAHSRGLKVRYWSTPSWPIGLREYIWRILVREGVDYLNTDNLRAATRGRWRDGAAGRELGRKGIWGKKEQWGEAKDDLHPRPHPPHHGGPHA